MNKDDNDLVNTMDFISSKQQKKKKRDLGPVDSELNFVNMDERGIFSIEAYLLAEYRTIKYYQKLLEFIYLHYVHNDRIWLGVHMSSHITEEENPVKMKDGKFSLDTSFINDNLDMYQKLLSYIYYEYDHDQDRSLADYSLPWHRVKKVLYTVNEIEGAINKIGGNMKLQDLIEKNSLPTKMEQESWFIKNLPWLYIHLLKESNPRLFLALWIATSSDKIFKDDLLMGGYETLEERITSFQKSFTEEKYWRTPLTINKESASLKHKIRNALLPTNINATLETTSPTYGYSGTFEAIDIIYYYLKKSDIDANPDFYMLKSTSTVDTFEKMMLLKRFDELIMSEELKGLGITAEGKFHSIGLMDLPFWVNEEGVNYRSLLNFLIKLRKFIVREMNKRKGNGPMMVYSKEMMIRMSKMYRQELKFYYEGAPRASGLSAGYEKEYKAPLSEIDEYNFYLSYKDEHLWNEELDDSHYWDLYGKAFIMVDTLLNSHVEEMIYQEQRGELKKMYVGTIPYTDFDHNVRIHTCHCPIKERNVLWRNVIRVIYQNKYQQILEDPFEEELKNESKLPYTAWERRMLVIGRPSTQAAIMKRKTENSKKKLPEKGSNMKCVYCDNLTSNADSMLQVPMCNATCQKSAYNFMISMGFMNPEKFELNV